MLKFNIESSKLRIVLACRKNLYVLLFLNLFLSFNSSKIDTNKLNQVLLAKHNEYRKKHGAPDLSLDNELIKLAQDYSAVLAYNPDIYYIAPSGNKNKNKENVGENIFTCTSIIKTQCYNEGSTKPVDDWYNEISNYNFNEPGFTLDTAHFTQLIWKSTTKLGCGASVRTDGVTYKVVCNYYTAGNIVDTNKYSENVLQTEYSNFLKLNHFLIFILLIIFIN